MPAGIRVLGLTLRQHRLLDGIRGLAQQKTSGTVTFAEVYELNRQAGAKKQRTTRADLSLFCEAGLLTQRGPEHARCYQPTKNTRR